MHHLFYVLLLVNQMRPKVVWILFLLVTCLLTYQSRLALRVNSSTPGRLLLLLARVAALQESPRGRGAALSPRSAEMQAGRWKWESRFPKGDQALATVREVKYIVPLQAALEMSPHPVTVVYCSQLLPMHHTGSAVGSLAKNRRKACQKSILQQLQEDVTISIDMMSSNSSVASSPRLC